ncbi:thiol-disulfide oxidoreductase DCC family protein [Baia soyae]|uniref:Putative DCC family thiol-disulfide oxidoreductase YuxK n=1 Tax=Baia soyae TaxID=1544746 RepID=A0A4R2RG67_9BACL|nr:DUF393 domain-containing protein [Baia soyae]TCP61548.1 putative DCC family thiol-disulfide oxidoreductase YuxK [Baia soyae]
MNWNKKKCSGQELGIQDSIEIQPLRSVLIFYDGWCPFCMSSIHKLEKWDFLKRLKFMSFRENAVVEKYGLDIVKLEKRIHSLVIKQDRIEEGVDTLIRISRNIPPLWVFSPILVLSARLGFGKRIYDWIASRRTIIPVGRCKETNCLISK